MTEPRTGWLVVAHLVATAVGFFGGAVIGGMVVAPLVFELFHSDRSFGYEFEGLEQMLIFGVLGAVVGVIGLNMIVARALARRSETNR